MCCQHGDNKKLELFFIDEIKVYVSLRGDWFSLLATFSLFIPSAKYICSSQIYRRYLKCSFLFYTLLYSNATLNSQY